VSTPAASFSLHGDKLPHDARAVRFEAKEQISWPYEVTVEFNTEDTSFHADALLRTRASLVVLGGSGEARYFDGVVDTAEFVHVTGPLFHFSMRIRPAMAALEHREGSRIFQDLSVVAVVQQIFTDAGFADKIKWRITKEYEPREFIVQYRETELNFVTRLLEEQGLFYYFGHSADGHTMVIADDPLSFGAEDDTPIAMLSMTPGGGGQPLSRFSRTRSIRPNEVRLRDYDFEKPQVKPEAQLPTKEAWHLPHYEYPARFTKGKTGALLADARMRELRRDADVCTGESRSVGLRCGVPFLVDGAAEGCLNGEFVVTQIATTGTQKGSGGDGNASCQNQFRAIPKGAPFAAERRAKKPRIRGQQTAIVTGSSQQEEALHVDKYGRIKVRFYWDRVGQQDHTSSCWIRSSQLAIGGSMILPRIGWEVSVAFLDGDPDKPLVLGRVYNAEKTPPYALPGAKTSGSIKSMSSPGGGGHNEIKMGDSGGGQGFGISAQKDMNSTVGGDKSVDIAGDDEHDVNVNESTSVGGSETVTVGGSQSIDVGAVLSYKIGGGQAISVGGSDESNAIANYVEKIGGSRSYSVGGSQITISNGVENTVTGAFTRTVGAVQINGSIASITDGVGADREDTVDAVTVHLVAGTHAESIGTTKSQTSTAAELHLTKASLNFKAASVTNLVGGLHYQKIAGNLIVKAATINIAGGVGIFRAAGSEIKLGGGPVVLKGAKIAIKSALIVKMGSSLKLGPG
jgi:type VI secretion system secreted protein VgrG